MTGSQYLLFAGYEHRSDRHANDVPLEVICAHPYQQSCYSCTNVARVSGKMVYALEMPINALCTGL